MEKYLVSGTIGFSKWINLNNNSIVYILHDNHSTETYCKANSFWISDLFNSLDSTKWEVILEEPERKYLTVLKSLWESKHVKDIRALTKRNIKRSDIRYNEYFSKSLEIPNLSVIQNAIKNAPLRYIDYIIQIYDYFKFNDHKRKKTKYSVDDLLYPGCIINWTYIFPYLSKAEALQCFKDFIFEGHLLSSINDNSKNSMIYAGSWHCRAIEEWLSYDNYKKLNHRKYPLSHVLEQNCIDIN